MAKWVVSGDTSLPILNDSSWDASVAREEIFKWAGWPDNPDPSKAKRCFFAVDSESPENKTAYKLPFCRIVDGNSKASRTGIITVVRTLAGARNKPDLPANVIAAVKRKVTQYYRRMGMQVPWVEKAKIEKNKLYLTGWAIVFDTLDDENDRFLSTGEFLPTDPYEVPVLFHHGFDKRVGDKIIGKAQLRKVEPFGVLASIIVNKEALPDEVWEELLHNLDTGDVGLSPGTVTVEQLAKAQPNDFGGKDWEKFIPMEISLTFDPMEPATFGVTYDKVPATLKSKLDTLLRDENSEGRIDGGDSMEERKNYVTKKELQEMRDNLQRYVFELVQKAKSESGSPGSTADEPTFAQFLAAVRDGDAAVLKAMQSVRKSASTQSGASGGWLIPPRYLPPLWEEITKGTTLIRRAKKVPMTTEQTFIPVYPADLEYSDGQVRVWGFSVQFLRRGDTATATNPSVEQAEFRAFPIMGLSIVENVFLEQVGGDYESMVREGFGEGVSRLLDWAMVAGTGNHEPLGILYSTATLDFTRTGTLWDDIRGMFGRLPATSRKRAVWVITSGLISELLDMVGPSDMVTFVGDVKSVPTMRLLGLPVMEADYLPAPGNPGDILLIDPTYYAWGTPREIMVAASEHVHFTADETVFRVTTSMAGMPWINGPMRLPNGWVVSPFVKRV